VRVKTFNSWQLTGLAIVFAVTTARAGTIGIVTANGYTFTNFDFPNSGTNAGAGTNANGISNTGSAVGFSIDNNGNFTNYVRNPNGTSSTLNLTNPQAMAFGINSAGDVVGQQNNTAFFLPPGGSPEGLAAPPNTTNAFGINDLGNIVGQYNSGTTTPGFYVANNTATNFVEIDAPSGPNTVNAQGVNDHGLAIGFYVGTDGQDHGFEASIQNAKNGDLAGTAIGDPIIPSVPGEPGATFVFSQLLGINDSGLVAGYYGDSTTSQHGFLYNTITGQYMFLDDPSEAFNNGVEVTQITGINNVGEISGFYSDAGGVFHGFVACPVGSTCTGQSAVPEPVSPVLAGLGLVLVGLTYSRRSRNA
jgi:hypothetical protein